MPTSLFDNVPDETFLEIIEQCRTRDQLVLARTCKRAGRLTQLVLYANVYFRHIGRSDGGREPTSWDCALCDRRCEDEVFNNEKILPVPTICADLHKFAALVAGSEHKAKLVRSLRLDIQSASGWNADDIDSLDGSEPSSERRRWYPSKKLKRAIDSVTRTLAHLPLSQAFFTSSCFGEDRNPRLIQTMGAPLPFVLILPNYALDAKSPYNPSRDQHQQASSSTIWDIETALEYNAANLDYSSSPPQVVRNKKLALRASGILVLHHYIGELQDLEKYIGAPDSLLPYRRWVKERLQSEVADNKLGLVVLRNQQKHFDFLDERYTNPDPGLVGSQILGNAGVLKAMQTDDKEVKLTLCRQLPESILLKDLELELEPGKTPDPLLIKLQQQLDLRP